MNQIFAPTKSIDFQPIILMIYIDLGSSLWNVGCVGGMGVPK